MAQVKERADELVFAQGLADSRERAKRLIMAGQVALAPPDLSFELLPKNCAPEDCGPGDCEPKDCDPEDCDLGKASAKLPEVNAPAPNAPLVKVDKPGHRYGPETRFVLVGVERFVSRGAYKLLTGLTHFGLDVRDFVCLDAGASTGGFSDCLLQHGAARVYAVDVGKGQLHERLRADARVISMEGVNLRTSPIQLIPEPVDLIVSDVSFISLCLVLPACVRWLKPQGRVLALIKPQFELGPHQTDKGVVRDPALRQEAVDKVLLFCRAQLGLACMGVVPSAIKGPKGNQEYLACFERDSGEMPQASQAGPDSDGRVSLVDEP